MKFSLFKNYHFSAKLLIIFSFFTAACFVRIYGLSNYSFSNDEAWHLVVANQKNLWEVIRYNFINEIHPPLSPIIWHLMLKISDNDLWLRFASLLSSILIIPSAYIFGRLWIGKVAGITMAFVCAFGAMPISLSSAIRAYSMLMLALLWIGIFAFRYLNDGKRKNLFFYFFCCLAAIELHHSAAFIVLTFGLLIILKSLGNKRWNDFFLIAPIHAIFALAVIGYSYVLTEYFGFAGNNGYFSSAQTFGLSLLNYLINFFTLFFWFLPVPDKFVGQTVEVALIIFFTAPVLFIFSRKWNLLAIIFIPFIAISLSDYFGYYPFSITPRNNLFLILSILIGYSYFVQIVCNHFINFLNYEKELSSFKLKELIKEKNFSLGIIIFRPFRIAFSCLIYKKRFSPIINFVKVLASLSAISLIAFHIFKQDFFRKTWPGCEEFLITKSDRNLLIDKLTEKNSADNIFASINTDIWKFQFESDGTIEVITPNLAKFKNNKFTIYFSSFPEREKGSNSSIAEYQTFFNDLFVYLKSKKEFQKIKSITFFDSGLNNDYLSSAYRNEFIASTTSKIKKDPSQIIDKFYFKDSSAACGREVVMVSFTPNFIKDQF